MGWMSNWATNSAWPKLSGPNFCGSKQCRVPRTS